MSRDEGPVLKGDVVEEINRLKRRAGKELHVHGSSSLARNPNVGDAEPALARKSRSFG
jgi:hypothetical protein